MMFKRYRKPYIYLFCDSRIKFTNNAGESPINCATSVEFMAYLIQQICSYYTRFRNDRFDQINRPVVLYSTDLYPTNFSITNISGL